MPPGLGEVAAEEEVLPRGGLESGAPGSCELDPAVWLCMRTEREGGEAGVWGGGGRDGEVRGRNGRLVA